MKLSDFLTEAKLLSLDDLSASQVSMLKKLASGGVDHDNVSPSQEKMLDSLNSLKLVDDSGSLTRMGKRMAKAAATFGSKPKRDAEEAAKKAPAETKETEEVEED